ncbi:hypothetical protein D9M68_635070 [compost metagenome]
MPIAAAITDRVNSSREPVLATCISIQGSTRRPATSITVTKPATSNKVLPRVYHSGSAPSSTTVPPSTPAKGGSSTSTSTVARSSTTSQPTAMRPFIESRMPRDSNALSSTTVLAQDSDRPKISPAPKLQPHHMATPRPSAVASPICTTAPGKAIFFTASKSSREKCRPTPNISSITPISESCEASATSATKPGVEGPRRMPAKR